MALPGLFAAKFGMDTTMGFVSMISQRQSAKANARISTANATTSLAAARYQAAVAERDAAEEYARSIAAANNMYGAAGIAAGSGSAQTTADNLYQQYKRDIDEIGVNKSFAELEYTSSIAMVKAQRKATNASASLNFIASSLGSAINNATDYAVQDYKSNGAMTKTQPKPTNSAVQNYKSNGAMTA